jgi:acyl carrier protein
MPDMRESLTSEVISIVSMVTNCGDITETASTENIMQWDSLAYMTILSEIEINYDLEINEENINKFESISSIVSLIIEAR